MPQNSLETVRYLSGIFSFAALASLAAMMRQGEKISVTQKLGAVLVGGCISVVVALWLMEDGQYNSFKVASVSIAVSVGITTFWDFLMVGLERLATARIKRLEKREQQAEKEDGA